MTRPDPRAKVWDRPADQLYRQAQARYDTIRNNAALNDDARTALLAQAWVNYRDAVQAAQGTAGTQNKATRADVERRVYGVDDLTRGASPVDQATISVSFRDAQARAAQLDNDAEALELLHTAQATGDELLVRAIGNVALRSDLFGGVMFPDTGQEYLDTHPDKATAFEQLLAMRQPVDAANLFQYVTPKPPELSAMPDSRIEALAANANAYRNA